MKSKIDSRLAEAAPELLEACKLAVALICGNLSDSGPDLENRMVLPALRRAIANADKEKGT